MLETIVEPLLAGVYGGEAAEMSARSVLGRFRDMEKKHGSLIRAARVARQRAESSGERASIFVTIREGLGALVEALAHEIEPERIEFNRRAVRIERVSGRSDDANYRVTCEDGSSREADRVILALPAWASAGLLAPLDPELGEHLAGIPYRSAVLVALVYPESVRARLPQGFGFLVPRTEERRLLACTFVHQKFQHRAPADRALLRCFLGGADDAEIVAASDEALLAIVRGELASILGIHDEPRFARVYRWPRSMAQYVVGHHQRLLAIQERLRHVPGIHLAGNAYSGIGIPDVIRTGEAAARESTADLAVERVELLQP
jgi:oxygen-dependent protoporphyrinogen oxidase